MCHILWCCFICIISYSSLSQSSHYQSSGITHGLTAVFEFFFLYLAHFFNVVSDLEQVILGQRKGGEGSGWKYEWRYRDQ